MQETPGKVTGRSAFSGAAEDQSFHTREGLPGWWTCDGICVLASGAGRNSVSRGSEATPTHSQNSRDWDGSAVVSEWGAWGALASSVVWEGPLWGESVRGLWTWLGGVLVAAGYRLFLLRPRLHVSTLPTSSLLSPSRLSISSGSLASSLPLYLFSSLAVPAQPQVPPTRWLFVGVPDVRSEM